MLFSPELSTKSDAEIVELAKNGSSDAIVVLAKRHEGILVEMARKYSAGSESTGVQMEELLKEAPAITYQAALRFEPSRNVKFVTWLGNNMKNFCRSEIRRQDRFYKRYPSLELLEYDFEPTNVYKTDRVMGMEDDELTEETQKILEILNEVKDEKTRKVVKLRYFSKDNKNRPFSSIASEIGISHQGAINLHERFMKYLRKRLAATGYGHLFPKDLLTTE